MPNVHKFHSSGEAYDASQVSDDIAHGDVLVVEEDQIVGFLFHAWPIAVSLGHGAFHEVKPGPAGHPDWPKFFASEPEAEPFYLAAIAEALAIGAFVPSWLIPGHEDIVPIDSEV